MEYFENRNMAARETAAPEGAAVQETKDTDVNVGFEALCRKYKEQGKSGFIVTTNLSQEDDMDEDHSFLFNEPKAASYDRYVKTASQSSTRAMRTFVLDNICDEQRKELESMLVDYPAMGISLGEKLLYMLGLSKNTRVRKL